MKKMLFIRCKSFYLLLLKCLKRIDFCNKTFYYIVGFKMILFMTFFVNHLRKTQKNLNLFLNDSAISIFNFGSNKGVAKLT